MNRFTTAKSITGLAVFGAALAAGAAAHAQTNGYYYDPCRRDQTQRGIVGGLVGAGMGAALGNNVAAGGHRGDGSLLGGVVGAMIGASVGNQSAGCTPSQPVYNGNTYYNQGYNQSYGEGYSQGGYYDAPQAYYAPPPVYVAPPVYIAPPPPAYYGRGYRSYGRNSYRGSYPGGYYRYPSAGTSLSFSYYGR